LVRREEIDGIIINGDLGYDINMNVEYHLEFMAMLSELAMRTPIILNRGNHEYDQAGELFCEYFEVYGLCDRNATAISIGPAYLSLFDPQLALIPRNFHKYTREERLSSSVNLVSDLERGVQSGRTIVALTHYPMVCSYPTTGHCLPSPKYN
jgi:DNA repair exonuclease SbcCD nuclease subunit